MSLSTSLKKFQEEFFNTLAEEYNKKSLKPHLGVHSMGFAQSLVNGGIRVIDTSVKLKKNESPTPIATMVIDPADIMYFIVSNENNEEIAKLWTGSEIYDILEFFEQNIVTYTTQKIEMSQWKEPDKGKGVFHKEIYVNGNLKGFLFKVYQTGSKKIGSYIVTILDDNGNEISETIFPVKGSSSLYADTGYSSAKTALTEANKFIKATLD